MDLNTARIRLDQLLRDCSRSNWDSYGALPIHPEAVSKTKGLLQEIDALNHYLEDPFVAPSNDGGIELTWQKSGLNNELMLEIKPNTNDIEFLLIEKFGNQENEIEGIIGSREWPLSRLIFRYCGEIRG